MSPNHTSTYIDASAGVSGDMLLAAFLDLGVDFDPIFEHLARILPPFRWEVSRARRRSIDAARIIVEGTEADPPRRTLPDILRILEGSGLSDSARAGVDSTFQLLADAEAKVHGTTRDQVHFHEVGAVDSLVDVFGVILAAESWGGRFVASSVPLGSGTVQTEHGLFPVPAPATLELTHGIPTHALDVGREVTTPTGIALLRTLADEFGPAPSGQMTATGYGAGSREGKSDEPPNVVRLWSLDEAWTASGTQRITILETQVDDVLGEDLGDLLEGLLSAGALDAFLIPTLHKKSRPGSLVTVLCQPEHADRLERELFLRTGTLGVRRRTSERRALERSWSQVTVRDQEVRVKCAYLAGELIQALPEFDDLRRVAESTGLPVRQLRQEALLAYQAQA